MKKVIAVAAFIVLGVVVAQGLQQQNSEVSTFSSLKQVAETFPIGPYVISQA